MAVEDHDDISGAADPEAVEKLWDELRKHNHRQQERMLRAIAERRSRGVDAETAFRDALREVVPDGPDEHTSLSEETWCDDQHAPFGESLENELAGESLVSEMRGTIGSRADSRNAIHFCNRQWAYSSI